MVHYSGTNNGNGQLLTADLWENAEHDRPGQVSARHGKVSVGEGGIIGAGGRAIPNADARDKGNARKHSAYITICVVVWTL